MYHMSDSPFSTDLIRSSADLVVLTLLSVRPMYGYEIMTSLADCGNGDFRFKQGTLYPLLYRLEREGWLEAKTVTPASGRQRKVYRLTKEGSSVQKQRAEEWERFTTAVNSIIKECDNHE